MIFADREQDREVAEAAVRSVGARVIGSEPIENALDRLNRQVAVDSVMIELNGSDATLRDRLLDWANHAAREGTTSPIISISHALIDDVMARIADGVQILCNAELPDRAAALALALAGRKHKLHDQGVEGDAERLRRLSEEVARIAGALAELSNSARSFTQAPVGERFEPSTEPEVHAGMVRNLIRIRRLREQFFGKELFADPAWDMLLDLLAARLEQSRVAVSSLCIAAAVPATTALRWIRTLTEYGLFVRRADPEDGRRIFIELSEQASDALTAYFQTAHHMGLRVG